MANPGWLNDNQFRDYPFITRVEPLSETSGIESSSSLLDVLHLPHSAIVDFGVVMDIDAGFDESLGHYVYLYSVSRQSDVFTFRFRTNSPDASNHELVFSRALDDPEFLLEWEDASTITPEESNPLACQLQPKWHGFIATGRMTDLAEIMSDGETIVPVPEMWRIEPSRIQSLLKSYLRSVSLANTPRVQATPQDGCSGGSDTTDQPAFINTLCMIGNLKWKEGFNCVIRQDINDNAIIIGAGQGLGEGQPCEEIPLYDGEQPPANSPFLSGGPACNDVVKSINGVGGKDVTITAGPGFRVQADPDVSNKIVVEQSLTDFAICPATEGEPVSESSVTGSDSESSGGGGGPVDGPDCNVFTTQSIFYVTITSGSRSLQGKFAVCDYLTGISEETGIKHYGSIPATVSEWIDGKFCSYRWQVRIYCSSEGLHYSVNIMPLTGTTPCITCTGTSAHPHTPPIEKVIDLTPERKTSDCNCVQLNAATRINVTQPNAL